MKFFKGILIAVKTITIIHLIVKVVKLEETQKRLVQLCKGDYEQLCAAEKDIEKLDEQIFNISEDLWRLKSKDEA